MYVGNFQTDMIVTVIQHTSLSRSSVAKYIAKFKKQGLIRHVGSNKTRGYRVVED
ncbi:MAG: hypothetical protein IKN99_00190 [Bacteroidales bacterium]|nr:hypothetical protein [Bacteroidales bacterium]